MTLNAWSLSASVNDCIGKGLLMWVCKLRIIMPRLPDTSAVRHFGRHIGSAAEVSVHLCHYAWHCKSSSTTVAAVFRLRHFFTTPHNVADSSVKRKVHISCDVFSERELKFMFAICRRPSVCRLSSVCNVRAPYTDDWNFRQCFYAIGYIGHLLTSR